MDAILTGRGWIKQRLEAFSASKDGSIKPQNSLEKGGQTTVKQRGPLHLGGGGDPQPPSGLDVPF